MELDLVCQAFDIYICRTLFQIQSQDLLKACRLQLQTTYAIWKCQQGFRPSRRVSHSLRLSAHKRSAKRDTYLGISCPGKPVWSSRKSTGNSKPKGETSFATRVKSKKGNANAHLAQSVAFRKWLVRNVLKLIRELAWTPAVRIMLDRRRLEVRRHLLLLDGIV